MMPVALSPENRAAALDAMESKFPTSAIAVLTFTGEWAEVGAASGQLAHFVVPRA